MLTHPTLDQLRALKLDGMADAFVELQSQDRAKRSRARRMAGAAARPRGGQPQHQALPDPAARAPGCATARPAIEDVDYRTPRRLDKALFQQLATGRWIAEHRNLLVTGPCGVGKSWLSCALAQKACRDGYTVHYARVPRLFADLELAHGDGRFARLFRTLVKADLLILDDWGPDRLTANQRRDLMEIVEDRYGRGSTLITSQLPVDKWHEVIGEPTFADAILDRIVHNAYRLALDGPSMRKIQSAYEDLLFKAKFPNAFRCSLVNYRNKTSWHQNREKYAGTIEHFFILQPIGKLARTTNIRDVRKYHLLVKGAEQHVGT